MVPEVRVRDLNSAPIVADGRYVLYWMVAERRWRFNYGLEYATQMARALDRPLLVFEPLRAGYPWASDRFHAFVLAGMAQNRDRFADSSVGYFPYVEPHPGAGRGLLQRLAEDACLIVSDDRPGFFQPRMQAAAAERLQVALQVVDSAGLLPMTAADKVFSTAHAFRRHLQRTLPEHLVDMPSPDPVTAPLRAFDALPDDVRQRWPAPDDALLSGDPAALAQLPIDHEVGMVGLPGGCEAGTRHLHAFVNDRLQRYHETRNHPDEGGGSGLSPYLHFGHVGAHQVLVAIAAKLGWTPHQLGRVTGSREGWWGMPAAHEAFLDEAVTWRELGLNFASRRSDFAEYASLPEWARRTLQAHASDPRPHLYDLEQLEQARTHDEIWNAAQTELLQEGRIHNYLRMLWGKKVLEWSPSPAEALRRMVALNNRWALDGRDANSYSGIFWVLGRYDRPWGPERPIFGTVRYMSSQSTRRKLRLRSYLERFGSSRPGPR